MLTPRLLKDSSPQALILVNVQAISHLIWRSELDTPCQRRTARHVTSGSWPRRIASWIRCVSSLPGIPDDKGAVRVRRVTSKRPCHVAERVGHFAHKGEYSQSTHDAY